MEVNDEELMVVSDGENVGDSAVVRHLLEIEFESDYSYNSLEKTSFLALGFLTSRLPRTRFSFPSFPMLPFQIVLFLVLGLAISLLFTFFTCFSYKLDLKT